MSVITVKNIKKWMKPLRKTPLHPQWLVYRSEKHTQQRVIRYSQGKILDIGCGDGWVEKIIPDDCQYFGLDYPPTVSLGYQGNAKVFADGQSLPFADGSFDTVLLFDVLEHIPNPLQAFKESWRVLKSGGNLISV